MTTFKSYLNLSFLMLFSQSNLLDYNFLPPYLLPWQGELFKLYSDLRAMLQLVAINHFFSGGGGGWTNYWCMFCVPQSMTIKIISLVTSSSKGQIICCWLITHVSLSRVARCVWQWKNIFVFHHWRHHEKVKLFVIDW